MSKTVVVARCVGCKHRQEIQADEVPGGVMPMCEKCYNVMVLERAERRTR